MPSIVGTFPGQPEPIHFRIKRGYDKTEVSGKEWLQVEGILTHSLCSSKVELVRFKNCDLSVGFFPRAVACFPNLIRLDLEGSHFTVLPECIQEFRFLQKLYVDYCMYLEEIRGIPPCLTYFSALSCKSLSPRSISFLHNQELHENGKACFVIPGETIPGWFEHRSRGGSISFWFRGNSFPGNALLVAILLKDDIQYYPILVTPTVTVNGKEVSFGFRTCEMEELFVFNMSSANFDYIEAASFENEWNHAEISYKVKQIFLMFDEGTSSRYPYYIPQGEDYFDVSTDKVAREIGIHLLKQKSSSIREDIRFTSPYK
ncbi:hypothetical protein PIB30_063666 [Stylosanthes scabra]|uniref:Uncharacterized protein n=1 Tax=Stylosanthes scabra TaxID=79078 RepID=A0ABU6QLZ1_9FABA|nr:hypothetical protein [Stylosanthes scabra]